LIYVKINEMPGFVRDIRPKVSTNNAVPCRTMPGIEFFFDIRCNIFFDRPFVSCLNQRRKKCPSTDGAIRIHGETGCNATTRVEHGGKNGIISKQNAKCYSFKDFNTSRMIRRSTVVCGDPTNSL